MPHCWKSHVTAHLLIFFTLWPLLSIITFFNLQSPGDKTTGKHSLSLGSLIILHIATVALCKLGISQNILHFILMHLFLQCDI